MNKKYKSRYGANSDITAAQYLVEFIMERIAKKEKTTLPYKFWNLPKWNKQFRMQIKYANELFSEFSEEEVFKALNTKQGKRIFSLGAKKTMIIPLIEEARRSKDLANNAGKSGTGDKITTDWVIEDLIVDLNTEQVSENKSLWDKLG